MPKFSWLVVFLISFCSLRSHSQVEGLSQQDFAIYKQARALCIPGTAGSALRIGFSFHIREFKNSPGFWVALTECYNYEYGKLNYGNLMKQLIDVGHLAQESTAALLFGTSVAGLLAQKGPQVFSRNQALSRFVQFGFAYIAVIQAYNALIPLIEDEIPRENASQRIPVFSEARQEIDNIKLKAQRKLQEIETQLANQELSAADRDRLTAKRQKILQALGTLNQF